MMFWIVAGLLAAGALIAVVLPALRARAEARRAADYDIAVYRDQLAEVERNRKRGQIGAAEAEAAKAEIGRRILDADQRRSNADSAGEGTRKGMVRAGAAVVGIAVPAGAIALYLQVGHPGMEAMPLAGRTDVSDRSRTAQAGSGGSSPRTSGAQGQNQQGGGQAASLEQAEQQLAARLEDEPQNTDGWVLLGRTRLSMGKYEAAVNAFERALQQAPDRTRVNAMYGEALVMANGGTVVPNARDAFETVLESRPKDARSRFYLGLAAQQAGEPERALERWRGLVADADPGAAYLQAVAERMAAVERELGIEPGTTFAEAKPEGASSGGRSAHGSSGSGSGGPTQGQVQAAQDMAPEARREMIQGMVDGLAGKLAENPNDADGWQRLIRSYGVLGQTDKAQDALATALETFEGDTQVRNRLIATAQQQDVPLPAGVEPPQQGAQSGGGAQGGSGTAGPTQEQMQAAEQMSPDERQAMIRSMVQRLADRLQDNPDNLQGWLQLARSYETLGQQQKAVDAYAKAAELAPRESEVLARYARALRAQEGRQTEKSVELSRRVLELDPENPEALWFTAMAELSEGDKAKARELFDRAIDQLPPDTPQTAELRKRADEMLQQN